MITPQKDFFISYTIPDLGVIDMTLQLDDFSIKNQDYFFICIEAPAPIEVLLVNGSHYTITTVQATAYQGKFMPIAISRVLKAGSTGTFSVGF